MVLSIFIVVFSFNVYGLVLLSHTNILVNYKKARRKELYYTTEERIEEILEFVKQNPRTLKAKVIQHMREKGMGHTMTIQPLIIKLIRTGKIKRIMDKPGGRNHYLYINDKNPFNQIVQEIARLEGIVKLFVKHERVNSSSWDTTRWGVQLLFIKIKRLNSREDFKLLYPKVVDLMNQVTWEELKVRSEADKRYREEIRRGKI